MKETSAHIYIHCLGFFFSFWDVESGVEPVTLYRHQCFKWACIFLKLKRLETPESIYNSNFKTKHYNQVAVLLNCNEIPSHSPNLIIWQLLNCYNICYNYKDAGGTATNTNNNRSPKDPAPSILEHVLLVQFCTTKFEETFIIIIGIINSSFL